MSEIFSLFEGQCPDCQGAVRVISYQGTQEFIDEFVFSGVDKSVDISVWKRSADEITDGEIEFECLNGCPNQVVAHNVFGDWN